VKAEALAAQLSDEYGVEARPASSARETVAQSDLVVTATTSREPVFRGEWLEEGTHVSGIGANAPAKQELDGETFRRSKIVVDFREQTLQEAGDLREAISAGVISADDVHAELGEIITGRKEGRANSREITLFKSVGIAVEDIATAAFVYEQAMAKGLGAQMALDGESLRNSAV
ncbi:MAG: ornithine cyclodeaminase family protein, partial [Blastocatellia bacterium]